MAFLRGVVTRWTDDDYPGWVEVHLAVADGGIAVLIDKVPVFGVDVTPDSVYPVPVELACEVLRYEGEVAVIVLDHGITDQADRGEFRVLASQVQ